MTVYLGVDLHPYQQTVCYCDTADGVISERTLDHQRDDVSAFYAQFTNAVVGIEASGALGWFETLLAEQGQQLKVGHPTAIRRAATSRHKNDRRDAALLLDLLLKEQFPAIYRRSVESETVLAQLRFRHALVKQRTMVCNHLRALARAAGLPRRHAQQRRARQQLAHARLAPTAAAHRETWLALLDELTTRIATVEAWLAARAAADEAAQRLLTHPGVGALTALCLAHTLGDVGRFQNSRQVVAYVGLDPVEHSSGERKGSGAISKAGSRLLRFLLGQAGLASLRSDEPLKGFYTRVSHRRGKAVAKVAVARKLLVRGYIMLRDQIEYAEFRRRGVEVGLPD